MKYCITITDMCAIELCTCWERKMAQSYEKSKRKYLETFFIALCRFSFR